MQYKTYQEAKIANPDSEIYYSAARRLGDKGFYSIRGNATGFCHKCYPKDYCMTMESFLASGKRLVQGDVYIGTSGHVTRVGRTTEVMNRPHQTDRIRYILKAKALENPANEWVNVDEWDGAGLPPVGVECEILFKEHQHKGFGLFSVLAYHGGATWLQYIGPLSNNGKRYTAECSNLEFRKPETTEQKLERERLEAAYKLYCKCATHDRDGPIGFETFKSSRIANLTWLAVVDETKYLRGQDYE